MCGHVLLLCISRWLRWQQPFEHRFFLRIEERRPKFVIVLVQRVYSNSFGVLWLSSAATHPAKEGQKTVEVGQLIPSYSVTRPCQRSAFEMFIVTDQSLCPREDDVRNRSLWRSHVPRMWLTRLFLMDDAPTRLVRWPRQVGQVTDDSSVKEARCLPLIDTSRDTRCV